MIELATAAVVLVAGVGGAGVALAWLNDRRLAASKRRRPKLDPKAILETRFAKGEIDEEEYNRRMRRLLYGPPLELE
ncbi:MAG TPA: SHOCT domain-containing protein [Acidimicrobiales bacterium]|nr:SHOCT domain-containing protein [Acidimicrobiales bacterium]